MTVRISAPSTKGGLLKKDVIRLIISSYDKILWMLFEGDITVLKKSLKLSLPIVEEVAVKYLKDQERIIKAHKKLRNGIDHYKIAGFLVFWIVKLKPVMILIDIPNKNHATINELLAINIAFSLIHNKHKKLPPFDEYFIDHLKYSLRYRINTRHEAALIFEALCSCLPKTRDKL